MHKHGLLVRMMLFPALFLLFSECQALPLAEEVDSSYCVIPVLGGTRGIAKIDYLKTYPVSPHVLISNKFGSLWTIKNFNEISTYIPELNLGFLDSSIYSLDKNAVFVFYGSINEAGVPRGEVHKFHGDSYPELISIDEVKQLGDIRKIQKDQNLKYSHIATLNDGFYGAARNSGLYIVPVLGGSRKVLGNQLVRPLAIELHPMDGRGGVLVNAYNGQFILAENNEANSKYCRQVTPKNNNNFKLTPLLTNVRGDVVWGALKIGDNKYLIYMQSDKYWVYDNGVVESIKSVSDAVDVISVNDIQSDDIAEKLITINSQRVFLRDKFYSYFVSDGKSKIFHGDIVSDIPNSDSYMLIDGELVFYGAKGIFKINEDGEISDYIANQYTVGSIEKIEPIPNHKAYLVSATYGLFIIDKNGVRSRLYLDGRINEYFHGKLVYDGIESYIKTSNDIYRIDAILGD